MAKKRVKEQIKISHTYCMLGGLVLVALLTAFSYIALTYKCEKMSREIVALEKEYDGYKKRFSDERTKWEEMKTCKNIRQRLAREGIHLQPIASDQIVRLRVQPTFRTGYAMLDDER